MELARLLARVNPAGMLRKAQALGAGERCITVHPNGSDEKGIPILIKIQPFGSAKVLGAPVASSTIFGCTASNRKPPTAWRRSVTAKRNARSAACRPPRVAHGDLGQIHSSRSCRSFRSISW